jgi:uncharacterized BrkB/YihY/UPF0761 family membrane protein
MLGLLRATLAGFIEDSAMSRGAAIAFYSFFSVAPLLVIALAIAGLVFGPQAAEGALAEQLRGLLGESGAQVVQGLVDGAADAEAGRLATLLGLGVVLASASGVFAEVQAALNAIHQALHHLRPGFPQQPTQLLRQRAFRRRPARPGCICCSTRRCTWSSCWGSACSCWCPCC